MNLYCGCIKQLLEEARISYQKNVETAALSDEQHPAVTRKC